MTKVGETMLEDQVMFGDNAWVYCDQHLAVHATGWCTLGAKHKTRMLATEWKDAVKEARDRGFILHYDKAEW